MSKVTICIPTFNSAESVIETIESLLEQTYKNITIKVFDNASTDDTVKILKQYPQIQVYESLENEGAEANFTKCIQAAEGDYTAIFHADDIYDKDIIMNQVRELDLDRQLVAVCTHANEIDHEGKKTGERFIPKEIKKNQYLDFNRLLSLVCTYGNFITCPSVLIRTDILKNKIKKWDGENFKSSADLDLWLRLTKFGKIKFLLLPLINYRVANVSTSFNMKRARTTRHDFFLVTDNYANRINMKNTIFLEFLEMKDIALRNLNNIKKNKPLLSQHKLFNLPMCKVYLYSFWHIEFFFKIIIISTFVQVVKLLRHLQT